MNYKEVNYHKVETKTTNTDLRVSCAKTMISKGNIKPIQNPSWLQACIGFQIRNI